MATKISRRALARTVTQRLLQDDADKAAIMRSLAAYLVEHDMVHYADAIMNDIAEELLEQAGLLSVEIVSARPLEAAARDKLVSYLKEQTGARTVDLRESVDESLIGGVIARTAIGELDASVRSKLRQLTALS